MYENLNSVDKFISIAHTHTHVHANSIRTHTTTTHSSRYISSSLCHIHAHVHIHANTHTQHTQIYPDSSSLRHIHAHIHIHANSIQTHTYTTTQLNYLYFRPSLRHIHTHTRKFYTDTHTTQHTYAHTISLSLSQVYRGHSLIDQLSAIGITSDSLSSLKRVYDEEVAGVVVDYQRMAGALERLRAATKSLFESLFTVFEFVFSEGGKYSDDFRLSLQQESQWVPKERRSVVRRLNFSTLFFYFFFVEIFEIFFLQDLWFLLNFCHV